MPFPTSTGDNVRYKTPYNRDASGRSLSHYRYSAPAGFVGGRWTQLEPQGATLHCALAVWHYRPLTLRLQLAYIQSLYHRTAVCDRCIETIQGVWLHCAYCGSDLCEECEGLGGHDNTHVFLVFKSMVCPCTSFAGHS
jgi:hypothetical protein